MQVRKKVLIMAAAGILLGAFVMNSCVHDPYVLPTDQQTSDPDICFERDILPIFQSNCAKSGCHDANSHEDGYTLNSYSNIVSRGIVPGNPAASKIYKSVTEETGEDFMPRDAPALPAASVNLIKKWIAAGAVDGGTACATTGCDSNTFTYNGAISPLMQTYCVGCHNAATAPGGGLTDYSSISNAALNGRLWGAINHLTGYSAMPQGGSKLSDCQLAQVRKWIAAGAPNN